MINLKDLINEDKGPCWKGYEHDWNERQRMEKKFLTVFQYQKNMMLLIKKIIKDFVSYMKENFDGLTESTLE